MVLSAQAQTPASVPYTPTWQARHHLQWLTDNAGLTLTVSHWPLPAAAVQESLDKLRVDAQGDEKGDAQGHALGLRASRDFVLQELAAARSLGRMQVHLRSQSEAMNAYGENYTPGNSAQLSTSEGRSQLGDVSLAGRLGARLEVSPNSLQTQFSGVGTEGQNQLRLDGPLPCWAGRAGICRPSRARTGGALAGRAAWSTGTTTPLGWVLAFSGAVLRRQTVFGSAGWGHGIWMCLWPRRKTQGWCKTSQVSSCFLACV